MRHRHSGNIRGGQHRRDQRALRGALRVKAYEHKMNDDRKHLTTLEVDKLLAATKGSRREARDRCLIPAHVPPRLARVRSRGAETVRRGHRGPQPARCPLEARSFDNSPATRRRAARPLRMAYGAGVDEAGGQGAVCERTPPAPEPQGGVDAVRDYGEAAGLALPAHPHMLRHACGFALADQGADTRLIQDYLGHRNIQHTVQYTATNPARFERL